jgi:hypothetical protein
MNDLTVLGIADDALKRRPADLDELQGAAYRDVQVAQMETEVELVEDPRHPFDRVADEWESRARGDS